MGGGSGSKGSSTETKEIKLPAWVDAASQANYKRAQGIADEPYNPYPGDTVAGLDPAFYSAYGQMGDLGSMLGQYGTSSDALTGLLGKQISSIYSPTLMAGQLSGTNLDPYMSSYTEDVIGRTTADMERSGLLAQNKLSSDAAKGGSFGGSRQAMQQAIQGAETTRDIGDYAAQAREANYKQAVEQAKSDIANRMTAGTTTGQWSMDAQKANAANQLSEITAKTGAASQLTANATAEQNAIINEIQTKVALGQISQEQAQREIDDLKAKWEGPRNYELENLNILLSTLGLSPYGRTETSTKTESSKSSGGMDFGGILKGGAGLIGALAGLSDREEKTDIRKLGRDEGTGLDMYAYRYKGDPKTYAKVVGPMAQDVEKKFPGMVSTIAGRKVIKLPHIAA